RSQRFRIGERSRPGQSGGLRGASHHARRLGTPAAYHPPPPRRSRGEFYVAHLKILLTLAPVEAGVSPAPSFSFGLSRLRSEARTGESAAPPGDANKNAAFAALRWHRGPSRTGTTARSTLPSRDCTIARNSHSR